ncbi:MAG: hypothetical protein AB3N14_14815 [Flavobacteriaceae bacterium]
MPVFNQPFHKTPFVISYITLRKTIGYIGICIPFFLVLGSVLIGDCTEIQSSISDYYHTVMRDGLVGAICAISFFLLCYRGYDKRDLIATRLAAIFALGIAFFPTTFTDIIELPCIEVRQIDNPLVKIIHFSSATLFFLTLAYMSIFLFTKSDKEKTQWEQPKKTRNNLYRISGYVIVGCLVLLALYFFVLEEKWPELKRYDLVFWLETIALLAFGISWLTKGETFFKDKKELVS